MKFEPGDHLITSRPGYTHHGIYIGEGKVIHYAGLADGLSSGPVEITTLDRFSVGKKVRVRRYPEPVHDGESAVARARSRLGEDRYDLQANNCEHFCSWVRTGRHVSGQVRLVESLAGAAGAGLGEFRRQRFHGATAAETARETGKAVARVFAGAAYPRLPVNPFDPLKKDCG